jgi:cytochrome b561
MAKSGSQTVQAGIPVYAPPARKFHWWVAAFIFLQIPLGLYMTYRAKEMPGVNDKGEAVEGVWDDITAALYSSHKVLGLLILALVVARLIYRLTQGAPKSDPSLPAAMTGISHAVHWSIYLLLLALPIGGYLGISYGNHLNIFGIGFPAITGENKDLSKELFEYHELAGYALATLVALHVGAAVYHRFVRKDRVVERMLPKRVA